MKKNTIQLILVLIVTTRAIVKIFHIDMPGVHWLNLAGGAAFMVLLIMLALDWRDKQKSMKEKNQ